MTSSSQKSRCAACRDDEALAFDFTMAFQPIVDAAAGKVWGYEALVRGTGGEPAWSILERVGEEERYRFDQACRVKAIELAGRLFPRDEALRLSINFMPNAVYEPSACIRSTLAAALRVGFRRDRIMFEFTEGERVVDVAHLRRIIEEYRRQGFITAIDDFGAGYAGLGLLATFQPDLIKIDMDLLRGIDGDRARAVIVEGVVRMARALNVEVLAEGVETAGEFETLRGLGIALFQGYHFAKPMLEGPEGRAPAERMKRKPHDPVR